MGAASGWTDRVRRCAAAGALLLLAPAAGGVVFHSREEALALAFPDADRIESRTFVLDPEQAAAIERRARSPLESKLVRVHTGFRGEELLGYAVIDVHNVRTLPEAFLVVLAPDGRVRSLRVLAFHEPLDYLPPERWYRHFEGRGPGDSLRLGGDVHGIVGATLSARATTRGVRRALAYYQVLLRDEPRPGPAPGSPEAGPPAG